MPLVLLTAVLILLYWPALQEFLYDWWHDDNYSHGFLIPVISGYLLWKKRDKIKAIEKQGHWAGLIFIIAGLGLTVLGTAAAEWYSVRFSMILVLLGLVLFLAGPKMFKETWFPIVFLIFAIPLPYTIFRTLTFPLQLFSTKVTYVLATNLGVTALRQGNIILLPNYSLEVVEACSGLRSIIVLSALAAIYSYMISGGVLKKTTLFLMAIPIAIFANIVRLMITVFGAQIIGKEFAEGFLHELSGLVVFLTGLFLFFLTEKLFSRMTKVKLVHH